jgi:hypothetical protein
MSGFLTHLLVSLADQAGTWFVGVVLALLGIFSGRLVETAKFALNRADLRTKYYEQLAVDLSDFVFVIDRMTNVYYGANWAGEDSKTAIAAAYDESMSKICRYEYVYLSWLQHYWNKKMTETFVFMMEKVRAIDAELIRLNGIADPENHQDQLKAEFRALQAAARLLLISATR